MTPLEVCENLWTKQVEPLLKSPKIKSKAKRRLGAAFVSFKCDTVDATRRDHFPETYIRAQYDELVKLIEKTRKGLKHGK